MFRLTTLSFDRRHGYHVTPGCDIMPSIDNFRTGNTDKEGVSQGRCVMGGRVIAPAFSLSCGYQTARYLQELELTLGLTPTWKSEFSIFGLHNIFKSKFLHHMELADFILWKYWTILMASRLLVPDYSYQPRSRCQKRKSDQQSASSGPIYLIPDDQEISGNMEPTSQIICLLPDCCKDYIGQYCLFSSIISHIIPSCVSSRGIKSVQYAPINVRTVSQAYTHSNNFLL